MGFLKTEYLKGFVKAGDKDNHPNLVIFREKHISNFICDFKCMLYLRYS